MLISPFFGPSGFGPMIKPFSVFRRRFIGMLVFPVYKDVLTGRILSTAVKEIFKTLYLNTSIYTVSGVLPPELAK
jgi:hypothetical protein